MDITTLVRTLDKDLFFCLEKVFLHLVENHYARVILISVLDFHFIRYLKGLNEEHFS